LPFEYEVELEIGNMVHVKNNIEMLKNIVRRFLQNIAGLANLMTAVTKDIDLALQMQQQHEQ
jgi:hypothetical protein